MRQVQVVSPKGRVIRRYPGGNLTTSNVAFAGPNKRTLFAVGSGADDANGQPIREGPQQTAATVYTLPMLSQGLPGRAK